MGGAYGNLDNPTHIQPVVDVFDRIERGEVIRALVDTPPQHGKTATELYGLVRHLKRHGAHSVAFVAYGSQFANKCSYEAREIARAANLELVTDQITQWRVDGGGYFIASSIGSKLTGFQNIKLIVVDDPFKDRADAESKLTRDKIYAWLTSTVVARAHPDTSIIITHTRWHQDDLIGRLDKQRHPLTAEDLAAGATEGRKVWESVHMPALDARGNGLWPKRRPKSFYDEQRLQVGEYDWASMWMGSPRPDRGSMFEDVYFFDERPKSGYRIAIGVDLAYTSKTRADYSVAVVMAAVDHATEKDLEGKPVQYFYVLDVVRMQVDAPTFGDRLKDLADAYPGAQLRAYCYGPEIGVVDFLRRDGVPIRGKAATGDKPVRAQPVSAAWRRGRVLIPRNRGALEPDLPDIEANRPVPWVGPFISELASFPSDVHDDQVDALAPAYDRLARRGEDAARYDPSKLVGRGVPIESRGVE